MNDDGIWSGSVGMEGKRASGKSTGKILKMGTGGKLENAGLHNKGETATGEIENERGQKGVGV